MAKKLIITEAQLSRLINEVSDGDVLKSRELEKKVKEIIHSTIKDDKDIEKKIRTIVGKVVKNLFKVLWQRNDFYINEI